jgi:hypothetical protein
MMRCHFAEPKSQRISFTIRSVIGNKRPAISDLHHWAMSVSAFQVGPYAVSSRDRVGICSLHVVVLLKELLKG